MTAVATDHRLRMVRFAVKKKFSVLGGKAVGTALYGQMLQVYSTFLPRPLGTHGHQDWTVEDHILGHSAPYNDGENNHLV